MMVPKEAPRHFAALASSIPENQKAARLTDRNDIFLIINVRDAVMRINVIRKRLVPDLCHGYLGSDNWDDKRCGSPVASHRRPCGKSCPQEGVAGGTRSQSARWRHLGCVRSTATMRLQGRYRVNARPWSRWSHRAPPSPSAPPRGRPARN